jgi:hypothetical protein
MDLQLLKSTVFRQILDNLYLANNGRYMALDGMVNIDDLLTSRPGGIVRVKTFDAVKPMQPPLLGAPAFNLLEYIDTIKENRTGVTRYNQGIDADSLNKTAQGINQIMSAAQARVELIARVFAETGVKDLFYAILENIQKHQDEKKVIRLRNEWVEMDPREWANRFDLSVMVGLGTGSKESQMAALADEAQFQLLALQAGLPILTPENVYNLRMKALEAKNIKGGDLFYTHPSKIPPQHPQPDPTIIKAQIDGQIKSGLQQMKNEAALHKQSMKQDFDAKKEQFKASVDLQKTREGHGVELQKTSMERAADLQMDREERMGDMHLQGREHAAREKESHTQALLQSALEDNKRTHEMVMKLLDLQAQERKEKSERRKKKETAKTE